MEQLNKHQLLQIEGGINITGTLINSFIKGINIVLDLGRSLGGAIRRIQSRSLCRI